MFRTNHSIAKKMALGIGFSLILGSIVIFISAQVTVSRIVRSDYERYAKSLLSVYGDLIAYESEKRDVPIDVKYSKEAQYYGDYVCQFYGIDYIYMFSFNPSYDTITYISFSKKPEKFKGMIPGNMSGVKEAYSMNSKELVCWTGSERYAISKKSKYERALEIEYAMPDSFGNKVMIGGGISLDDLDKLIHKKFLSVALVVLLAFAIITLFIYMSIIRNVSKPAGYISQIMTDYISNGKISSQKLNENGKDEFAMIARAFNKMSDNIDSYVNHIQSLSHEQERQNAEIEIASSIQMGFLPSESSEYLDCKINAILKPAKTIGGDLYDYHHIDKSHTLIVIGDVSGKGVSAALFMTATLSLVRLYTKLGYSPGGLLKNTNSTLVKSNPNMLFATAFVGIYDSEKETLTYSNAGHNPPFLIHEGKTQLLEGAKNTLIGLFDDEEYIEETVSMHTGDTVLLYTDGVTEASDEHGAFYGIGRLEQVVRATADTPEQIFPRLKDSMTEFVGNAEQHDDITLLSLTATNRSGKQSYTLLLDADANEWNKIRKLILDSRIPKKTKMDLCLAAEELFVNICSYAFEGNDQSSEKIEVLLEISYNQVLLRFTDGGKAYDPRKDVTDCDDYDIEKQIGGLGKVIAFNVTDHVSYEYKDNKNILTIIKDLI